MGVYFFAGLLIYLLILVILMVWFLKYHNNNDQNGAKPFKDSSGNYVENIDAESSPKPNHNAADIFQTGAQSRSEKSEVLPGYCGQSNNHKLLKEGNEWTL
ncbi:MAG: hypothetical protein GXY86_10495 [Firmicutes bacterium]|nr:hypothetical protein [Bacillota bacterium]